MKVEDILECSLPKWYPSFEKVTFPTVNIPIPPDVLEYLRENGSLVLPTECNKESYNGTEDDYDDFGDIDWDQVKDEGKESDQKSFPEFSQSVQKHMNSFGGDVFVKLNWFRLTFSWRSFQKCRFKLGASSVFVTVTKSVKKKPSASLTTSHLLFEFSY